MKKNNLLVIFWCAIFSTFALPHNSIAEDNGAWCSGGKIILSGSSTTQKQIFLYHQRNDCGPWPAYTSWWFNLDDSGGNANAMLAAALTAHATGKTVTVVPKNGLFAQNGTLVQVFVAN